MVPDMPGDLVTDPLAARYGRPYRRGTPLRRPDVIAVALLAAAGIGWLIWVALAHSSPPVSSRLLSFSVDSPTAVSATIQVERTEDAEASCRLQASAADFAIVGETTVRVPADAPRRQTVRVTITTQRPATTVVLVGCTTPGSGRPH
jgi:Domain of unknown function (DUF4307)